MTKMIHGEKLIFWDSRIVSLLQSDLSQITGYQLHEKLLRAMYCMDLWGGMDGPELLKLLDHLNGPECTPYTEPWDDDGTEDAQKYEF